MPATSIYYTILQAVQTALIGLGLSGINANSIVIRKLPRAEETLDTLPLICICPRDEPEEVELLGFENQSNIGYLVDIVVIAAGNHDFTTNLDQYLSWRETIRRKFQQAPLVGAPTVWRTEVFPLSPLDREVVDQNYDYSGLSVLFHSAEPTQ